MHCGMPQGTASQPPPSAPPPPPTGDALCQDCPMALRRPSSSPMIPKEAIGNCGRWARRRIATRSRIKGRGGLTSAIFCTFLICHVPPFFGNWFLRVPLVCVLVSPLCRGGASGVWVRHRNFFAIFLQIVRNASQLDSTLPDRNPPPPPTRLRSLQRSDDQVRGPGIAPEDQLLPQHSAMPHAPVPPGRRRAVLPDPRDAVLRPDETCGGRPAFGRRFGPVSLARPRRCGCWTGSVGRGLVAHRCVGAAAALGPGRWMWSVAGTAPGHCVGPTEAPQGPSGGADGPCDPQAL